MKNLFHLQNHHDFIYSLSDLNTYGQLILVISDLKKTDETPVTLSKMDLDWINRKPCKLVNCPHPAFCILDYILKYLIFWLTMWCDSYSLNWIWMSFIKELNDLQQINSIINVGAYSWDRCNHQEGRKPTCVFRRRWFDTLLGSGHI